MCFLGQLKKILTDLGRRNVSDFLHALSCYGPATTRHLLAWLVASTSKWVVGLTQRPNRGARARWSERQFRCAKIKRSKPFSKHHATNAPVCNSIYTHIYIHISCDHSCDIMRSFHSMHVDASCFPVGSTRAQAVLGSAGRGHVCCALREASCGETAVRCLRPV